MRGNGQDFDGLFVAPLARAAVFRQVGAEHLAVRLFRRHAEAVLPLTDWRKVDRRDERAALPVAPEEDDDIVVVVVGDEPFKALPRKVDVPEGALR